jgi:hypothetical protein
MVNSAGSLAGAALAVGLLGVTIGVTGRVVKSTNRQLKGGRKPVTIKGKSRNARLRRSGIM